MVDQMVHQVLWGILPWIIGFGLLSLLMTAFLPRIKGWLGETLVNTLLKRQLDPMIYHLIPDVMLPTDDGTTQIDHVVVSRYGIFVLETKNYKGWIFGGEHDAQWTQQIYRQKNRFQNPLRQNYKHTKTLSELTGIPESYFKPVVVFLGEATFKTPMSANVVYARDCSAYIRGLTVPLIKDEQVTEVAGAIQEWAATVTAEKRRNHVAHVRGKKESAAGTSASPGCPKCGANMVMRQSRKDGRSFWGCTKYPACRGILASR